MSSPPNDSVSFSKPEESVNDAVNSQTMQSQPATEQDSKSKNSRKRTKTGCLTCRKRRIKCGEERPICNNCIKSKRNCEGYNHRAIYRDPGYDTHGLNLDGLPSSADMINLQYHHHASGPVQQEYPNYGMQSTSLQSQFTPLAPRPLQNGEHYQNNLVYSQPYPNQTQTQPVDSATQGQYTSNQPSTWDETVPTYHMMPPRPFPPAIQSIPLAQQLNTTSSQVEGQLPLPLFHPSPPREHSHDRMSPPFFRPKPSLHTPIQTDYVDSDDEMDLESPESQEPSLAKQYQQKAGLLVAIQADYDHSRTDSSNILATYRPSGLSSPLMDSKTARIFCHFVTVTASILSIHERHAIHPTLLFGGKAVPRSQQGLWTYTMPTLALSSPPLLHAMLSLACLQIAKLTHASVLPSLKHYHMALRRVARNVSVSSKRNGIDTLAATLLLGYYEVVSGEQSKWNRHLLGARQLLVETDFLGMSRRIRSMKAEEDLRALRRTYDSSQKTASQATMSIYNYMRETYLGPDRDVDERLIDRLTGRHALHDQFGQTVSEDDPKPRFPLPSRPMTAKDIDDYDLRRDLFWWFLKQDFIQSVISSNKLLLDYRRWTHCPPRAPMGRLDASCGTFDHLILVLGRLADFASKDVARKRRSVEAMGGVWRPSPDMNIPQPPTISKPPTSSGPPGQQLPFSSHQLPPADRPPTLNSPGQMPQGVSIPQSAQLMTGMMPAPPSVEMPKAFANDASSSPASSHDDSDLETATSVAEAEWNSIKNALDIFEDRLGSDFHPLPPDPIGLFSTPFGPAVYYRNNPIAAIRLFFLTARIIQCRVHPSMPPAAMMAAGVAASQTAQFAIEIGRVVAGILPMDSSVPKDPTFDSTLLDASLALFFAGIQYQDAAQRGWTINKLNAMAERLGWGPVQTIASGCERAWEKAAQMGRGPPYMRTMDPWAKDDRIAGRPLNPSSPVTDDNDRRFIPVNAGARLHWAVGLLGVEDEIGSLTV